MQVIQNAVTSNEGNQTVGSVGGGCGLACYDNVGLACGLWCAC